MTEGAGGSEDDRPPHRGGDGGRPEKASDGPVGKAPRWQQEGGARATARRRGDASLLGPVDCSGHRRRCRCSSRQRAVPARSPLGREGRKENECNVENNQEYNAGGGGRPLRLLILASAAIDGARARGGNEGEPFLELRRSRRKIGQASPFRGKSPGNTDGTSHAG